MEDLYFLESGLLTNVNDYFIFFCGMTYIILRSSCCDYPRQASYLCINT